MKNNSPIAILLATCNSEKFLKQQIDSILEQTNQEWTLFIKDDCSTDGTLEMIDHYAETFKNKITKLPTGTQRSGAAYNFESMLQAISSDYYMFCDHDDSWLPTKIDDSIKQMRLKEKEFPGTAVIVHTDLAVADEHLKIIHPSFYKKIRVNPPYFSSFNFLGVANCVTGCTMLINDMARIKTPPLPLNFTMMHDWWIAINISKLGKIVYIPKATILYRQHASNAIGLQKGGIFNILYLRRNLLYDKRKFRYLRMLRYGNILKYIYYKVLYQLMRYIKK
jgi:glycosyltransferase involved in cell wall biosynthesis